MMSPRDTLILGICALLTGTFGVVHGLLYSEEYRVGNAAGVIVVSGFIVIVGVRFLWQFFKMQRSK